MFTHILVGVDGSEAAQRALEGALELAALCGAELLVVSVEEKLPAPGCTTSSSARPRTGWSNGPTALSW